MTLLMNYEGRRNYEAPDWELDEFSAKMETLNQIRREGRHGGRTRPFNLYRRQVLCDASLPRLPRRSRRARSAERDRVGSLRARPCGRMCDLCVCV